MVTLFVELLDTTLRDGEQVEGVQYSKNEKLILGKLILKELNIDRIEFCSALVSKKEKEAAEEFCKWAEDEGYLERIEILGFLNVESIEWIKDCNCKVVNLLAKGSVRHMKLQLKHSPEEHLTKIMELIDIAREEGLRVNIYFEAASHGWKENREILLYMAREVRPKVERIMFPDTLGIFSPEDVETLSEFVKSVGGKLDFHAHNDYGLALANSLKAIEIGFTGLHGTINGMGERAGNTALEEIIVAINDLTKFKVNANEKAIKKISELVERFSGKRVAFNKPIVGENVFFQTAGIHADGDKKGNLYVSKLNAERFGVERNYALGKLSGKASIEQYLKKWAIEVGEEEKKEIVKRIVELGERKRHVTEADLLFIVNDVIRKEKKLFFELLSFQGISNRNGKALAYFKAKIRNEIVEHSSLGVGIFDAFINGLRELSKKYKFKVPKVLDYTVSIPKGGGSDALVEVTVIWSYKKIKFRTVGMHQDQTQASIIAIEKAINFLNMLPRAG